MILQNIIFPDAVCPTEDIYFRLSQNAKLNNNSVILPAGSSISTDTYMNAFDIGNWQNDTTVGDIVLTVYFQGKGRFFLKSLSSSEETVNEVILLEKRIKAEQLQKFCFSLPHMIQNETCCWEIKAEEDSVFHGGNYSTDNEPSRKDIHLAVNICTFHREKQLSANLKKFMTGSFFQEQSELNGKMHIFVTDNGNSFPHSPAHLNIHIHNNSNKGGGSGGFARGLEEIKKLQDACNFTHVVFMDDDVEFQMESFYRLFAWLSYLKKEKQMTSIAGRMFRLDRREIQYTAVEIWNKGDIRHVDGSLDMSAVENALRSSAPSGDYGGWWFCTYPAEFALNNRPFPFFIHCDDVEYGLRFPGQVMALRGVQVWHETYEYRVTPQIIYYDIRNPMVVNALHGVDNPDEMVAKWQERLEQFHREGDQMMKYLCILAMYHFTKGYRFFRKGGKLPEVHEWMKERKGLLKIINPVFRRYVIRILKIKKRQNYFTHTYQKEKGQTVWLLR